MKLSLSWLKEYVDLPPSLGAQEIADRLTAAGLEIEGIEDSAAKLQKVVVGQIKHLEPHPGADKLSFCKVDVGAKDLLEIVCGAKNISQGDKVPVAQVGADLPNGLLIKKSKIRGVASEGMLCSPDELCLNVEMEDRGIYLLASDAPIGQAFADYINANEVILDASPTPNRGDELSHYGVARELGAIFNVKTHLPEIKLKEQPSKRTVSITNSVGESCPAYFARLVEGVKIAPSPDWLKNKIESIGLRSINNAVDITSLVMFEVGQPLHAFDADTLGDGNIVIDVRAGRENELFSTISHQELKLSESDIVISSGENSEKAAALGGVMGSDATEVSEKTTNILLESALFTPGKIRRTSKTHSLQSDAAFRFERGVNAKMLLFAIDRAASLLADICEGRVGELASSSGSEDYLNSKRKQIAFSEAEVENLLGSSPGVEKSKAILESLGLEICNDQGLNYDLKIPSWRHDLNIKEDLVEEVGRIWGFDNLESDLPYGEAVAKGDNRIADEQIRRVSDHLVSLGFYQAINYAFTNPKAEELVLEGQFAAQVDLLSFLSQEYTVMKTSLVPGVLRNLAHNLARQNKNIRLFEIRRVFNSWDDSKYVKSERLRTQTKERLMLSFVMSGELLDENWSNRGQKIDFFDLKGIVEGICDSLGKRGISFEKQADMPFLHPGQSAKMVQGNKLLGQFGKLHPRVQKRLGLDQEAFVAEIELDLFLAKATKVFKYKAFSKYPHVERDFSAVFKDDVSADAIRSVALKGGKPLARKLIFFDLYKGERVADGYQSYAFRLIFKSDEHTLTDEELSLAQESVMQSLTNELGAEFAGN